jgi:hypothetical protein
MLCSIIPKGFLFFNKEDEKIGIEYSDSGLGLVPQLETIHLQSFVYK